MEVICSNIQKQGSCRGMDGKLQLQKQYMPNRGMEAQTLETSGNQPRWRDVVPIAGYQPGWRDIVSKDSISPNNTRQIG